MKQIFLVLLAVLGTNMKAYADTDGGFDEKVEIQKACGISDDSSGLKKAAALAVAFGGHPILLGKNIWGEAHGSYGLWEVMDRTTLDNIENQVKQHIAESPSCYSVSGEIFRFWNLSFDFQKISKSVFKDDSVAYHEAYMPASEEQQTLYEKCTTLTSDELVKAKATIDAEAKEQEAKAKKEAEEADQNPPADQAGDNQSSEPQRDYIDLDAIVGKLEIQQASNFSKENFVIGATAVSEIYSRAIQSLLKSQNPTTCDGIHELDQLALSRLMKINQILRYKINKAGYKVE